MLAISHLKLKCPEMIHACDILMLKISLTQPLSRPITSSPYILFKHWLLFVVPNVFDKFIALSSCSDNVCDSTHALNIFRGFWYFFSLYWIWKRVSLLSLLIHMSIPLQFGFWSDNLLNDKWQMGRCN